MIWNDETPIMNLGHISANNFNAGDKGANLQMKVSRQLYADGTGRIDYFITGNNSTPVRNYLLKQGFAKVAKPNWYNKKAKVVMFNLPQSVKNKMKNQPVRKWTTETERFTWSKKSNAVNAYNKKLRTAWATAKFKTTTLGKAFFSHINNLDETMRTTPARLEWQAALYNGHLSNLDSGRTRSNRFSTRLDLFGLGAKMTKAQVATTLRHAKTTKQYMTGNAQTKIIKTAEKYGFHLNPYGALTEFTLKVSIPSENVYKMIASLNTVANQTGMEPSSIMMHHGRADGNPVGYQSRNVDEGMAIISIGFSDVDVYEDSKAVISSMRKISNRAGQLDGASFSNRY